MIPLCKAAVSCTTYFYYDNQSIQLGVYGPIACFEPNLAGFLGEEGRSVCLWNDDEANASSKSRNNHRHPRSPAPSKVAGESVRRLTKQSLGITEMLIPLRHETTNDRTENGTNEGCSAQDTKRETSLNGIKHICKLPSRNGEWSGRSDTAKEAEQHDGLDILSDANGDLADDEQKMASEERRLSPP